MTDIWYGIYAKSSGLLTDVKKERESFDRLPPDVFTIQRVLINPMQEPIRVIAAEGEEHENSRGTNLD